MSGRSLEASLAALVAALLLVPAAATADPAAAAADPLATSIPLRFRAVAPAEPAPIPDEATASRMQRVSWRRGDAGIVAYARRARYEGAPLVKFWEGKQAFVALGVSNRGVPGLYVGQRAR